ncbi:MAG: endolytic transglycosylase MltG [Arcobacteraceae bacterium]|nr:endolytic transglycosylase MltG [Arcobacteraceae bacterium]
MIPFLKAKISNTREDIKNTATKIKVFNTIDFVLIVFITILFYLTLPIESKRVVFIPKGSTSNALSYLNQNGYSLNFVDRISLFFIGYPQSGWMDMGLKSDVTKMTKLDFLYKITTSKAALTTVTLVPGETYYFFLNELSQKLKLPREELFKVYYELAYKKDGNILSQTYNLPIGMNPRDLLLYLFQYTEEEYQKYSTKIFGKYNKEEWYRYITIASVIQKESASKGEMTQVSGVIYNRLAKKMKLQMDGTLNHGEFSHTKVTPTMIANDNTSYNTYKFAGIPSDPVCAVEFEAIKAAIFPAKNSYLFFMKKIDGSGHSFAQSFSDHKANIDTVVEAKKKVETTEVAPIPIPSVVNKPKEIQKKIEKPKKQPEEKKLTTPKNTPKSTQKETIKPKTDKQKPQEKKKQAEKKQATKQNNKTTNTQKSEKAKLKEKTKEKAKEKKVYDKLHKEKEKKEQPKQKPPKELWKNI